MFSINGHVAGLELFDDPVTFAAMLPKLVRSYALDAIDTAAPATFVAKDPAALVAAVAGAVEAPFPAVALGEDLRLEGETAFGAALAFEGRLLHLAAFPRPTNGQPPL